MTISITNHKVCDQQLAASGQQPAAPMALCEEATERYRVGIEEIVNAQVTSGNNEMSVDIVYHLDNLDMIVSDDVPTCYRIGPLMVCTVPPSFREHSFYIRVNAKSSGEKALALSVEIQVRDSETKSLKWRSDVEKGCFEERVDDNRVWQYSYSHSSNSVRFKDFVKIHVRGEDGVYTQSTLLTSEAQKDTLMDSHLYECTRTMFATELLLRVNSDAFTLFEQAKRVKANIDLWKRMPNSYSYLHPSGAFIAFEEKESELKIFAIFVPPTMRRYGIGTMMVNLVQRYFAPMSLTTVLSHQESGDFFHSLGFDLVKGLGSGMIWKRSCTIVGSLTELSDTLMMQCNEFLSQSGSREIKFWVATEIGVRKIGFRVGD